MNKVKVQGERWFPSETKFSDEMASIWGKWYCDSEVGKLRAVLLRRPGKEIEFIEKFCKQKGADFAVTKCFAEGGAGSIDLANKVIKACEKENNFRFLYDINMPIYEKIETIAKEIYGADGVEYTKEAKKSIDEFIKLGCDNMPVCMVKTQYSLSDNPALLGRLHGFKITVSSASLSNGAGFLVCQTGSVMTMPGLSKSPAAYKIDIDENGNTVGLF